MKLSAKMSVSKFRFESWGVSDKGCVRELNEDSYLAMPESGVWVVADGMGGHEAGELASRAIVAHCETIGMSSSLVDLQARFVDRIYKANSEIQEMSRQRNGVTIGATLVGLLMFENELVCIWSGDSRIYRLRKGRLEQLTHDHTEVQQLLDQHMISPQDAETWGRKNVITQAIGVEQTPALEKVKGQILAGDTFILCSDGLTAHLRDDDILEQAYGRRPQDAAEALVNTTIERGATDNVTVVVVQSRDVSSTVPFQTMQQV
nr:protein phosphatase 2C domain-containing protein [uncultured Cohaesibacter sp.]